MERSRDGEPSESGRDAQVARVLVVDDEPAIREVLVSCLTLAGFEVLEACDVASAVRLVELSLMPVELALVDMHLPDGNGVELVKCLTRPRPNLPVILMSGASVAEASLLEQYPILVKPFSLGALIQAVKAALD